MKFKTIYLIFTVLFSSHVFADIFTAYRYVDGQCVNSSGHIGQNPYPGECGILEGQYTNASNLIVQVEQNNQIFPATDAKSLRGAWLINVHFQDLYLENSDGTFGLDEFDFTGSRLEGKTFKATGSSLKLAYFDKVIIGNKKVIFHNSNLRQARFLKWTGSVKIDFKNADLTSAVFHMISLAKSNFKNAVLNSVSFFSVSVAGSSSFKGIQMEHSLFAGYTDGKLSNFSNADLRNSIFCGTNFSKANLSGANLSGSILGGNTTMEKVVMGKETDMSHVLLANFYMGYSKSSKKANWQSSVVDTYHVANLPFAKNYTDNLAEAINQNMSIQPITDPCSI